MRHGARPDVLTQSTSGSLFTEKTAYAGTDSQRLWVSKSEEGNPSQVGGVYSLREEEKWPTTEKQAAASAKLFASRLQAAGFNSHYEYVNSKHWKFIREMYRLSGRPKKCFCCDEPNFQLHHVSYARIGHENLNDLLPLCETCHRLLHKAPGKATPYSVIRAAQFFFSTMSHRWQRERIMQFTNRSVPRNLQRFKNSGCLQQDNRATGDFKSRIEESKKVRYLPPPSTAGTLAVKELIRKMNSERR